MCLHLTVEVTGKGSNNDSQNFTAPPLLGNWNIISKELGCFQIKRSLEQVIEVLESQVHLQKGNSNTCFRELLVLLDIISFKR